MKTAIQYLLVVLCSAWISSPAMAVLISGQFSGTAVNVDGYPFSVQEGDAVTGTFSFDTGYPYFLWAGDGSSHAAFTYGSLVRPDPLPPPPVSINIEGCGVAGDIVDVDLAQDASGQTLQIHTGYGPFCCAASLTLAGAPGAFFSSLEMAAIHAGEVDLSRSFASYSLKGQLYFGVALTGISFDAVPVPEPASLSLLVIGLGALLVMRRRG
ncbi:MAG TPA: PEP-CTERM sorting domain-containing protein [Rhodocyclaceae bacterium]|nr:PEP-CTERM sorting domain-containing protein [Rhodocyclaceae bacterium]